MIFTDELGRQWEWRGEYRKVVPGDWFLEVGGQVMRKDPVRTSPSVIEYAIVHPAPKVWRFGGIVFEETGEFREPRTGEWFLAYGRNPVIRLPGEEHARLSTHAILRPARIES